MFAQTSMCAWMRSDVCVDWAFGSTHGCQLLTWLSTPHMDIGSDGLRPEAPQNSSECLYDNHTVVDA